MNTSQEMSSGINKMQPDYLPARTLCEYAFCPRAGYIEWVQNDNADNYYTLDGTFGHKRIDAKEGALPEKSKTNGAEFSQEILIGSNVAETDWQTTRSIMISSDRLGLIAKIDLLETNNNQAIPVEYKRGNKPEISGGVYEPARIQLAAHALLLRENGFECDQGMVYYIGSKERVSVAIDQELIDRTLSLAAEFRSVAQSEEIPNPLSDSSKCNGCSLAPICLPDEVGMLSDSRDDVHTEPRRLIPARDDALPVYIQVQGGYVGKSGELLIIKEKGKKIAEAKLFETSQLVIMGNAQVTTQTLQELFRRGIPVIYCSTGGWFYGMATGPMNKNIDLRLHQYRTAMNQTTSLNLAKTFINAKIKNARTMLRRNIEGDKKVVLRDLMEMAKAATKADNAKSLLGYEGNAAKIYFGAFEGMIKKEVKGFSFDGRNRRPPKDPVNALLSLAYSLLAKDLTVSLQATGFDPYLGFYHQPRYGRPSLALDLMEEFRPIVADSVVITVINNAVVSSSDFIRTGNGVNLKSNARRRFILAYERRMDQLIRHPIFGYQISYRRVLNVQSRLLGRYIAGEIKEYPAFMTR